MCSFKLKMYQNRFQTPLRELTTLPQILQSAGEGTPPHFPPSRGGPISAAGPGPQNGVKMVLTPGTQSSSNSNYEY